MLANCRDTCRDQATALHPSCLPYYKHIVNNVLKLRPQIQCKRHEIVKLPSVMLSEFDSELEKAEELRGNVRRNIMKENQRQKQKFQEMKQKYDREGVEYIQDELELADRKQREGESYDPVRARQMLGDKAHTLQKYVNLQKYEGINIYRVIEHKMVIQNFYSLLLDEQAKSVLLAVQVSQICEQLI